MIPSIYPGKYSQIFADVLILSFFKGETLSPELSRFVPSEVASQLQYFIDEGEIDGREFSSTLLHRFEDGGVKRVAVVGLGDMETFSLERFRGCCASLLKVLLGIQCCEIGFFPGGFPAFISTEQLIEAFFESYVYASSPLLKSPQPSPCNELRQVKLGIVPTSDYDFESGEECLLAAAKRGVIIGEAVQSVRELSDEPGNRLTPATFALQAEKAGNEYGLDVKILDMEEMSRLGMNLITAVSRGSHESSRLIMMEYNGCRSDGESPFVLLGKGVTFDSGGISLKRGSKIFEMKRDMMGGAIAFATVIALARLKAPVHLISIIVAAENMPGRRAFKPGDIITSLSGKTVEIFSTDAEGRLLLADTLTYTQNIMTPTAIIDIATLTGGAGASLGPRMTPYFSNSRWFSEQLQQAANRSGEKFWEMPLAEEYHERVVSHFADYKSNSPRPPGTISAALFLQEFVSSSLPWIHIDIAGVDTNDKAYSYIPAGATGIGTRTLIELFCLLEPVGVSQRSIVCSGFSSR